MTSSVLSAMVRLLLPVLLLLVSSLSAGAEERITAFVSQVDVLASGDLVVEESISVIAEGSRIRRGIYRDFPTRYTDEHGAPYRVAFSVVSVERDGKSESYHTVDRANGIRVYMGSKDVKVAHGAHSYTLRYITNRQIGFFPDHDELYWNVTGNGWSFPIDRAEVTVTVPESGTIEDVAWYTGRTGERLSQARLVERSPDSVTMETSEVLPPGSGFTVVVSWPKGLVVEPGAGRKIFWFIRDFFSSVAGAAGLLILVLYYFISWQQVGRDPEPGPVIPLFSPPENISPAAARYILKMGFDEKSFAAVLVNMAVKGVLKIEQQDSDYTLHLLNRKVEKLTAGELAVRNQLFKSGDSLELKQENNRPVRAAISMLKKVLRRDLASIYFKENRGKLIPGLVISLVILLTVVLSGRDIKLTGFITLWLIGWSGGVLLLFVQMVKSWRIALSGGSGFAVWKKAVTRTFYFLPFFAALITVSFVLYKQVSWPGLLVLAVTLAVNCLFAWLLKAPTLAGRKIMDQLEGLRLYLSVAEKDRLEMFNPPEKTPKLFEQMLPWALVLDVEQQWAEQFSDILSQTGDLEQKSPAWYSSNRTFSSRTFSSALGSGLISSIASSSTAPGSSSGFSSGGGGGSSGGGGGGGGGGGW
jgi:uncharacterized membrane protein YgcG